MKRSDLFLVYDYVKGNQKQFVGRTLPEAIDIATRALGREITYRVLYDVLRCCDLDFVIRAPIASVPAQATSRISLSDETEQSLRNILPDAIRKRFN